MKFTKQQLKQIIKEELSVTLNETGQGHWEPLSARLLPEELEEIKELRERYLQVDKETKRALYRDLGEGGAKLAQILNDVFLLLDSAK